MLVTQSADVSSALFNVTQVKLFDALAAVLPTRILTAGARWNPGDRP
jgi:hypothetical protein